jgi:Ca2+-transporting ATPase
MASKGYRVLGYAIKEIDALPEPLDIEMLESSLLFIGFAGMIDPQGRSETGSTQCKEAGNPVMITGDHKATAGSCNGT